MELTAGGRSLAEANIQRGICSRKCTITITIHNYDDATYPHAQKMHKYNLSRLQEKTNPLMYVDDIKLFAKNEKDQETLIHAVRIYSQDTGMEVVIENVPC